jgi:hypothetical protein
MLLFTARAVWLFIMHGSIESSMKQIGEALLETLTTIGRIKTDKSKLGVLSERGEGGTVFCHITRGTTYEKHLYLDALRETLNPVDNPRYIVVRRSWFTLIEQRDYHRCRNALAPTRNTRFLSLTCGASMSGRPS